MRIPMTAREQLLLAREHGHELMIETRGPWPEHGDPHPKYYVSCTCGWHARTQSRSRKAANAYMAVHLGKAIADALEARQSSPGRPVAEHLDDDRIGSRTAKPA
jgi:hypothetical protein